MSDKKLYRSRTSKMLCGVCGGIGEYFNIDPTLIRLAFVLFGCTGGGIVAYIIAAIIIPDQPVQETIGIIQCRKRSETAYGK